MKIVIPGGTGQIGSILAREHRARGSEVVIVSREAAAAGARLVEWDGRTVGPWEIARAWEREQIEARTPRTRKVLLRTAMVMSPDEGGVLDVLLGLTRFGLGGAIAEGDSSSRASTSVTSCASSIS